ncbi:MAG: SOS response-associated peptidase [Bacteroidales bacterium]
MCGRFTLSKTPKEVADHFGVILPENSGIPLFNAAPGQSLPVITQKEPGQIALMHWGMTAAWQKSGGQQIINARSETLTKKKLFGDLVREGRCLVPADGFYEWMKLGRRKQPFRFLLKSESVFAFAGLVGRFTNPAGEQVEAFAILTTAANELVAGVHNRMPVIIREGREAEWISESLPEAAMASFFEPFPAAGMQAYKVSPGVNKASVNHAGLIRPWEDPTLTLF